MRSSLAFIVGLALLAPAIGVSGSSVTADSLRIEYGFVPASVVRAHPEGHEETAMHDGPPSGAGAYHLVVALFDARTGARVEDAEVAAAVGPLGLEGAPRKMERMQVGGTVSYGNYFRIAAPGPYRIRLQIKRPGSDRQTTALIDHRFESSRDP